jgi:hypothetical protein
LVETVTELAITTPDADFLTVGRVKHVFTPEEIQSFITAIEKDLIPNLRNIARAWNDNYSYNDDQDPDDYFESLSEALDAYLKEFADDEEAVAGIKHTQGLVQEYIADLREEHYKPDPDWDGYEPRSQRLSTGSDRSVFDDVDT